MHPTSTQTCNDTDQQLSALWPVEAAQQKDRVLYHSDEDSDDDENFMDHACLPPVGFGYRTNLFYLENGSPCTISWQSTNAISFGNGWPHHHHLRRGGHVVEHSGNVQGRNCLLSLPVLTTRSTTTTTEQPYPSVLTDGAELDDADLHPTTSRNLHPTTACSLLHSNRSYLPTTAPTRGRAR